MRRDFAEGNEVGQDPEMAAYLAGVGERMRGRERERRAQMGGFTETELFPADSETAADKQGEALTHSGKKSGSQSVGVSESVGRRAEVNELRRQRGLSALPKGDRE